MRNEFTAVVEHDGDWVFAYCPEIPDATIRAGRRMRLEIVFAEAIVLIPEGRPEDGLRGVPAEAAQETIMVTFRGTARD